MVNMQIMSGGILKYYVSLLLMPIPDGPLSKVLRSEGILLANKEVAHAHVHSLCIKST